MTQKRIKKAKSNIQHVKEVNASIIHILDSTVLCIEQKQNITVKKLALLCCFVTNYLQHSSNFC